KKKFNITDGVSLLFEFTPKSVNNVNEAMAKNMWKKNWNALRTKVSEHLRLNNSEKLFLLSRMDDRDDMIESAEELRDYFNELLKDDHSDTFQIIVVLSSLHIIYIYMYILCIRIKKNNLGLTFLFLFVHFLFKKKKCV
ncbi:hypothetical protein RFI_33712, partial [Reticulomyxa filosa]